MKAEDAKKLVVKAGIKLVQSGLIARTWGNVSCRIDSETFAITPSGRDYMSLSPEDIVEVKISDLSYSGSIKPSSEKGIHKEVYERFPHINFVIHTHQENASAISAAGIDEIPIRYEDYKKDSSFSEKILCSEYALPGTKALRKNVATTLNKTKSNAIVLKHHGALCYGKDYESTFITAHQLEDICLNYINEKGGNLSVSNKKNENALPHQLIDIKNSVIEKKGGYVLFCNDAEVLMCSKMNTPLLPYLDDFAQIVGLKSKVCNIDIQSILKALNHSSAVLINNIGALCWGINKEDAEAVNMILRKNSKAYLTAKLFNNLRPINPIESALMRLVYLKKYSKLSEKK